MNSAAAGTFEIGILHPKRISSLLLCSQYPISLQAHAYRYSTRTDRRPEWRLTSGELAIDCSDDGRECTRFAKYGQGRLNRSLAPELYGGLAKSDIGCDCILALERNSPRATCNTSVVLVWQCVTIWSRICVIFLEPSQISSIHLNRIDPRIASGDLRTLVLISFHYSGLGRLDSAYRCKELFEFTTPLLNIAGLHHTQLTCHGYC
jgi:hypothetical protein